MVMLCGQVNIKHANVQKRTCLIQQKTTAYLIHFRKYVEKC